MFSNLPATSVISSLSLHDALPILRGVLSEVRDSVAQHGELRDLLLDLSEAHVKQVAHVLAGRMAAEIERSEEHTSELQSRGHLVCRLLLEKKKEEESEIERTRDTR